MGAPRGVPHRQRLPKPAMAVAAIAVAKFTKADMTTLSTLRMISFVHRHDEDGNAVCLELRHHVSSTDMRFRLGETHSATSCRQDSQHVRVGESGWRRAAKINLSVVQQRPAAPALFYARLIELRSWGGIGGVRERKCRYVERSAADAAPPGGSSTSTFRARPSRTECRGSVRRVKSMRARRC